MRKIFLGFIGITACFFAQAKKVQFNVTFLNNSALVTPTVAGAHIMGDFQLYLGAPQNFDPGFNPMTQDATDTNVWHCTVDIPARQKYEFKFLYGDQSYEAEIVPVVSQVGHQFNDNRWFFLDSISTDTLKLPTIEFGANAWPGYYAVRMLLDMQTTTMSANGVHVVGGYQSSNPASDQLYSFIPDIYEEIGYMQAGMQHFNYVNGNTNNEKETISGSCAMGGMRMITVSSDIILNKACFGSCDTCVPIASVFNVKKDIPFAVSPNPVQDQFSISFNDQLEFHHLAIADLQGRILRKYLFQYGNNVVLQRDNLPSGVYQLMVRDDRLGFSSTKLVIE
ncbi:MAG: T9SS type A sorting domain-containing protein [Chitinophagaceae bacterium]|nr:T9SS type A sorting domain-containing protein [Chitinophagaceae bacterium]